MLRIHREGIGIILIMLVVVALILVASYYFLPILFPVLVLGAMVLLGLTLNFFRNPDRSIEQPDNQIIYSPADGKVVVMEEVMETEYYNEKRLQLSIFMSIYDIHANRMPIGGTIKYYKYHEGKYLLAKHPKSSIENERNTTVVESVAGNSLLFRQIAGAVARRIRAYIKTGDIVEQGQEMGFIKFGSRVDLFLPLDAKIEVKIGDKVKAGISILGRF